MCAKTFLKFLKDENVDIYHINSEMKAAIVERFNLIVFFSLICVLKKNTKVCFIVFYLHLNNNTIKI